MLCSCNPSENQSWHIKRHNFYYAINTLRRCECTGTAEWPLDLICSASLFIRVKGRVDLQGYICLPWEKIWKEPTKRIREEIPATNFWNLENKWITWVTQEAKSSTDSEKSWEATHFTLHNPKDSGNTGTRYLCRWSKGGVKIRTGGSNSV